ncbi:unnamed protein product [Triticum turgidum subsp. durum]|uniref:Uncharacterized protein n=1 Tax=Triticum turgidum subsp. durum TaxID=4567 RepID=A0A9R1PU65_TRITD|nr:unnamed protein product [Triticum turgidum subsp. durum]
MKASCFLVVLLLAIATESRLSLAAREGSTLGGELGELIAKAGSFLTSAGRAGAKSSVNCIPADMCRRKKVLCGKRCYKTSHAAGAGLDHVPSNRCVVRCKKCVPTC